MRDFPHTSRASLANTSALKKPVFQLAIASGKRLRVSQSAQAGPSTSARSRYLALLACFVRVFAKILPLL